MTSPASVCMVQVYADDTAAAQQFYCDALGFTHLFTAENDGFHWVNLVSPSAPGLTLVVSEPHAGRSQENGDALAALLAKGELAPLQLTTEDLAATFDKVAAAPGAEVLAEPADQPWGVRDCAVRDPAGNLLRIRQA